jgi:type IV secretion system protein VirB10
MNAENRRDRPADDQLGNEGGEVHKAALDAHAADRPHALPGEAGIPNVAETKHSTLSHKGVLAVGLLVLSLMAVAGMSITRFAASGKKLDDGTPKLVAERPAASGELRRLDMTPLATAAASSAARSEPRIPAILPTDEEVADPIGVRRTGQAAPSNGGARPMAPEDAPVLLVSTRPGAPSMRTAATPSGAEVGGTDYGDAGASPGGGGLDDTHRNLQGYQRQLQGLLDSLTRTTGAAAGQATGASTGMTPAPSPGGTGAGVPAAPQVGSGLFGGQLQGSSTPRVTAGLLGNRSLTLPKGTAFTCALKTRVVSAASGFVSCQVQRNVYSDDGRVLLIERGSHMDGEYRIASVRPGTVRIPVLWTRIRTPNAVTVDIESPGTGPLGESGIDGYVDNRWVERIGAAMLLSLIDDSVKLLIQNQANQSNGAGDTIVFPSTTANASKLAEKVLDSTISIPPLIYQNQGGIVGIYVARDVDFSSVYELRPVAREGQP